MEYHHMVVNGHLIKSTDRIKLRKLRDALEYSWSEFTAHKYDWTANEPATNQDLVSALAVNEALPGLVIVRAKNSAGKWHYWNRFQYIQAHVDMTADQFKFTKGWTSHYRYSEDTLDREMHGVIHRDDLLEDQDVLVRYKTLRKRVADWLMENHSQKFPFVK